LLETVVQPTGADAGKFSVTVWGLVIRVPLQPKLRLLWSIESADVELLWLAEKLMAVTFAALTLTARLSGLKVRPVVLGVTV
jgi:hypothetical protein